MSLPRWPSWALGCGSWQAQADAFISVPESHAWPLELVCGHLGSHVVISVVETSPSPSWGSGRERRNKPPLEAAKGSQPGAALSSRGTVPCPLHCPVLPTGLPTWCVVPVLECPANSYLDFKTQRDFPAGLGTRSFLPLPQPRQTPRVVC